MSRFFESLTSRKTSGQIIANIALATWLLADAVRFAILGQNFLSDILAVLTIAGLVITAAFVLVRPQPSAQDVSPLSIFIAFAAVLTPTLMIFLIEHRPPSLFALTLQLVASATILVSIIYLGRNFSIIPQYRSITSVGPYRFVRHPIYGAYLIFDGSLVIQSASVLAFVIWSLEAALLTLRAQREETLLSEKDPQYQTYLTKVPYRFVPYVV